jgi:phosphatidylserine decarboxylase
MTAIFFWLLFLVMIYLYWRYWYFFRNPERIIPQGDNLVSPADGTIVYIRKVENNTVPISIKNKTIIHLNEITKEHEGLSEPYNIVGIFMHPTSVHVNRSPIKGVIKKISYFKSKNFPMTLMWWRVLLKIKPYELHSNHILQNERNTFLILGKIPVWVVQIADIYVNKIDCWVKINQSVNKGERLGIIKMGSQVDMLFPSSAIKEILVSEGEKVIAGETVLATLK